MPRQADAGWRPAAERRGIRSEPHAYQRRLASALSPDRAAAGDRWVLSGGGRAGRRHDHQPARFRSSVPAFPGGLAPATWVKFGHVFGGIARADWQFVSPRELRATVPADALSGPILLTRLRRGEWPWDDDEWIVIAQSPQSFTALPITPTGLSVVALGSNAFRLAWSYAGSAHTGFAVSYRESGGAWKRLPTDVPADRRFFYLWDALPSTTYGFTAGIERGGSGHLPNARCAAGPVCRHPVHAECTRRRRRRDTRADGGGGL
jgi:hypothetical protein